LYQPFLLLISSVKGAGSNNYNDVNREHPIASFIEALKVLDGVEVDMQMSLDGTIWLFHDIDINYSLCTPGSPRSILTMQDDEIAQLKLCSRTKTEDSISYLH
jgi:glycerophosphoryl diester phosphodiesterase